MGDTLQTNKRELGKQKGNGGKWRTSLLWLAYSRCGVTVKFRVTEQCVCIACACTVSKAMPRTVEREPGGPFNTICSCVFAVAIVDLLLSSFICCCHRSFAVVIAITGPRLTQGLPYKVPLIRPLIRLFIRLLIRLPL